MESHFFKKNWDFLLFFIVIIIFISWLIYGERGFFYFKNRKIELKKHIEAVDGLTKENLEIKNEIDRMQKDDDYIARVIREYTDKLKENEIKIYNYNDI